MFSGYYIWNIFIFYVPYLSPVPQGFKPVPQLAKIAEPSRESLRFMKKVLPWEHLGKLYIIQRQLWFIAQ